MQRLRPGKAAMKEGGRGTVGDWQAEKRVEQLRQKMAKVNE